MSVDVLRCFVSASTRVRACSWQLTVKVEWFAFIICAREFAVLLQISERQSGTSWVATRFWAFKTFCNTLRLFIANDSWWTSRGTNKDVKEGKVKTRWTAKHWNTSKWTWLRLVLHSTGTYFSQSDTTGINRSQPWDKEKSFIFKIITGFSLADALRRD